MSNSRPFAYARNNHGTVTLPHWQDWGVSASIPNSFGKDAAGARYAPRDMPANFAWRNGKPAQAQECNFGGLAAVRPPLQHDNSYVSNAWRWRGPPMYADEIVPADLEQ